MRKDGDLSIIVVNYNTKELLQRCIYSIYSNGKNVDPEIWVVDNASTDGSAKILKDEFPKVHLIANEENVGYVRANNQAVRQARGRYILLLNPDTVILGNALERLVEFVDEHPLAGIVGPKVYDDESRATVQLSCRGFPTYLNALFSRYSPLTRLFPHNKFSRRFLMSDWGHNGTIEVDWVSGCCMIIRKEVLEQIGLLDEQYKMFFEDVDICYRARRAGWGVFYHPKAEIIHYIGKTRSKAPFRTIVERHRSMKHFYTKHYRRRLLGGYLIISGIYVRMALLLLVVALKVIPGQLGRVVFKRICAE